jgi:TrmH family RNA methyltransferase
MKIATRTHAIVQACRALANGRGADGVVLLDGEHLIAEALRSGVRIRDLVAMEGTASALVARVRATGATVYEATTMVMDAVSPVRTPSGLVAIAAWVPAELMHVFLPAPAFAIGLVGVQDPGNAGAVIRSAHALGATGVVVSDGTADPAGWKALRGAMGSTFHVPVSRASLADALAAGRQAGVRVLAAVASQATPIERADLSGPCLLLLGNEGAGLSDDVLAEADTRVTVPMRAGIDSLNVAVTAALILYEARRQRADVTR